MTFPAHFMSNTKWLKVFIILSRQAEMIHTCLMKTIWDDRLREIPLPTFENFDQTFHDSGIKDVLIGGPLSFKEIEWLEFPAEQTRSGQIRHEESESFKHTQDILSINEWLIQSGQLEIELTPTKLIVYGYK